MDLKNLLVTIQNTFKVKKEVEFDNLHIVMEPLNTTEEMKVVEACADSGTNYVAQLKKSSLAYAIRILGAKDPQTGKYDDIDFKDDIVEYPDETETGKMVKETKYLFLLRYVEAWPVAFRDEMFDAFNDMLLELEDIISKKVKFERFNIQTLPEGTKREEPGVPAGFKKVEEPPEEDEPLTDAEKLSRQVKKEGELVEADMGRKTVAAINKVTK